MARRRPPHGDNADRALFRALTGQAGADPTGQGGNDPASINSMLLAAFGSMRGKPGRADLTAAAKSLGVSRRTAERWVTTTGQQRTRPSRGALQGIRRASRQSVTRKDGRTRTVAQARQRGRRGIRLRIAGTMGPTRDYQERRIANIPLQGAYYDGFLDAYERGGQAAALDWVTENSGLLYGVDNFTFTDIDEIRGDPI